MSFGRILVTGANGQVGGALLQTLAPLGEVVAPLRGELDLTSADSICKAMRAVQPRWVVNSREIGVQLSESYLLGRPPNSASG